MRAIGGETERLLKAFLVLSRSVEETLEGVAVRTAAKGPFSVTKARLIRLLGHQDGQTSSRIAHFLGVSKPAITQVVAVLAHSGLVRRKIAINDRRVVTLHLTPRGRALYHAIRREQLHLLRVAVKLAPRRRSGQWVTLLPGAAQALARSEKAFSEFCLQCPAHTDSECLLAGGNGHEVCPFHRGRAGSPHPAKESPSRAGMNKRSAVRRQVKRD